MCEANAYLVKEDQEELLMEAVDVVAPEGDDRWRLVSIFGEQKSLKARLRLYNNSEQKILFEPV